jgi:hypothetical protein
VYRELVEGELRAAMRHWDANGISITTRDYGLLPAPAGTSFRLAPSRVPRTCALGAYLLGKQSHATYEEATAVNESIKDRALPLVGFEELEFAQRFGVPLVFTVGIVYGFDDYSQEEWEPCLVRWLETDRPAWDEGYTLGQDLRNLPFIDKGRETGTKE